MYARQPCVVRPGEFLTTHAVQLEHLVVPNQTVVDHVPFPHPDVARTSGKLQSRVGLTELPREQLRMPAERVFAFAARLFSV